MAIETRHEVYMVQIAKRSLLNI